MVEAVKWFNGQRPSIFRYLQENSNYTQANFSLDSVFFVGIIGTTSKDVSFGARR